MKKACSQQNTSYSENHYNRYQTMTAVIIDELHYDCCYLDTEEFLQETLGSPSLVPEDLQLQLEDDWAFKSEKPLLQYFESSTGIEYERVFRDNSCNYESDLGSFFVYTVYAPVACEDWLWATECFVTIEVSYLGGDPRSASYDSAKVYRLTEPIAETGFLNWMIGWRLTPFNTDEYDLNQHNERLRPSYSDNPTAILRNMIEEDPEWNPELKAYVGVLKDFQCEVMIEPEPPWFG